MYNEQREVVIFLVGSAAAAALIGMLLVVRLIFTGWEGLINP